MSSTAKRLNHRYSMASILDNAFVPLIEEKKLVEILKMDGGSKFSFNKLYMDHVKHYLLPLDYQNLTGSEAIYIFKHGLKKVPTCYCGQKLPFLDPKKGYAKNCSKKCAANNQEAAKLRQNTNLNRYGTQFSFASQVIKDKITKTKIKNNSFSGYRYNMNEILMEDFIPTISEYELNNELLTKSGSVFCRNRYKMDHVKYYLNLRGIDYSKLGCGESLYLLKNNLKEIPKCNCGKFLNYHSSISSYGSYCGYECSSHSSITKTVRRNTCLELYGVENYASTSTFRQNSSLQQLQKNFEWVFKNFEKEIKPNFQKEDYLGKSPEHVYSWKCLRCDKNFESSFSNALLRPKCPGCDGLYTDLEWIIKTFLDKNSITYKYRDRSILNGKELDFYLPNHSMAIEVNGLYFHNETVVDKNYHLSKTIKCKEKDTKLIHLYTDEIVNNWDIVQSRLKHALKLKHRIIHTRKCQVRIINSRTSNKFLTKYHIQGPNNNSICLGLFYKNRLVSVMTFSATRNALGYRIKQESVYELVRFCSIFHFKIPGAASKLLSYFEQKYKPTKVISYADCGWSDGSLYKQLGFDFIHHTKPNYWYTKNYRERLHRFQFQKHLLKDKLEDFDVNKTEHQNMNKNGYYRVYDCGSLKFEKTY